MRRLTQLARHVQLHGAPTRCPGKNAADPHFAATLSGASNWLGTYNYAGHQQGAPEKCRGIRCTSYLRTLGGGGPG